MIKVDVWAYLAPATADGHLAGRPVGVTMTPGGETIHQAQRESQASGRVFHVKGHLSASCEWEELWADGQYIYRAIDLSRPARDGGPYTLRDDPNGRGSKWAARRMGFGEVFARQPYIVAFDVTSGLPTRTDGPVPSWLKLAAVHRTWHGVDDVVELWWLTESPTQTTAKEKYFYGRGLGLVGFEGPGLTTRPNHVWPALPPAAGVPVLARKAVGFPLPAVPREPDAGGSPAGDFWLLNPCHSFPNFVWSGYGERPTPEPDDGDATENHHALDIVPGAGAVAPFPIVAAAAGRVLLAGSNDQGYGWLVKLDHGQGRETLYAHLEADSLAVKAGDTVIVGQRLGNMGSTGRSTGLHLHFEYRVNGVLTNPTPLLRDTLAPAPVEPPVVVEPEPEPLPAPGLVGLHLTLDEARQFQAALEAERDAKNAQIRILAAALARAGAA